MVVHLKRILDGDKGTVDVEHSAHTFRFDAQMVRDNILALYDWVVWAWVEEITPAPVRMAIDPWMRSAS